MSCNATAPALGFFEFLLAIDGLAFPPFVALPLAESGSCCCPPAIAEDGAPCVCAALDVGESSRFRFFELVPIAVVADALAFNGPVDLEDVATA